MKFQSLVVAAATLSLAIGAPIKQEKSRAIVAKDAVKRGFFSNADSTYFETSTSPELAQGAATPEKTRSLINLFKRAGIAGKEKRYEYIDTPALSHRESAEDLTKRYDYEDEIDICAGCSPGVVHVDIDARASQPDQPAQQSHTTEPSQPWIGGVGERALQPYQPTQLSGITDKGKRYEHVDKPARGRRESAEEVAKRYTYSNTPWSSRRGSSGLGDAPIAVNDGCPTCISESPSWAGGRTDRASQLDQSVQQGGNIDKEKRYPYVDSPAVSSRRSVEDPTKRYEHKATSWATSRGSGRGSAPISVKHNENEDTPALGRRGSTKDLARPYQCEDPCEPAPQQLKRGVSPEDWGIVPDSTNGGGFDHFAAAQQVSQGGDAEDLAKRHDHEHTSNVAVAGGLPAIVEDAGVSQKRSRSANAKDLSTRYDHDDMHDLVTGGRQDGAASVEDLPKRYSEYPPLGKIRYPGLPAQQGPGGHEDTRGTIVGGFHREYQYSGSHTSAQYLNKRHDHDKTVETVDGGLPQVVADFAVTGRRSRNARAEGLPRRYDHESSGRGLPAFRATEEYTGPHGWGARGLNKRYNYPQSMEGGLPPPAKSRIVGQSGVSAQQLDKRYSEFEYTKVGDFARIAVAQQGSTDDLAKRDNHEDTVEFVDGALPHGIVSAQQRSRSTSAENLNKRYDHRDTAETLNTLLNYYNTGEGSHRARAEDFTKRYSKFRSLDESRYPRLPARHNPYGHESTSKTVEDFGHFGTNQQRSRSANAEVSTKRNDNEGFINNASKGILMVWNPISTD